MKSFKTEILTPQKIAYSGEVDALVLNGELGSFGVLAGHAPLIARLAPGKLKLTRGGEDSVYKAGAGFVRVDKDRVSIMLDEIKETTVSK